MSDLFIDEKESILEALFDIAEATGIGMTSYPISDRDDCHSFLLSMIAHHIGAGMRAWYQANARIGTHDERKGDDALARKSPIEVVTDSMLFGTPRKSRVLAAKAGQ